MKHLSHATEHDQERRGSSGFPARLELKPALDIPRGPVARATARQRDFLLVDWLRRGFGHREN